jgi:phenylacetate-coenzyme A ligase PaaK-like adenylate-forming protein
MKMHMSGLKVPRLGSIHDKIYRQYLTKESQKESKKIQLLALSVINTGNFSTQQGYDEWGSKIKKLFNAYLSLEYGIELPEQTEKELEMMEYYESTVKHLRPKLHIGADGRLAVSGLEALSG